MAKKRIKYAMILAVIFVILTIIGIVFVESNRTARLNILVAPANATVKINGAKMTNGTYSFFPKHLDIEISAEGFESKHVELDLSANTTTQLHEYLTYADDNFSYYETDESSYEILKLIADEKANVFVKKLEKLKTITKILPLNHTVIIGNGKTTSNGEPFYETVIEDGSTHKDCSKIICLLIKTNLSDDSVAKELLDKYGYNLDDYEVIYEK